MDIDAAARRYAQIIPRYTKMADALAGAVHNALLDEGIGHLITKRTKDFASLVRKAILKGDDDPFTARDLAGVRVIVPFFHVREQVAAIVHDRFVVRKDEDKADHYGHERLGYLGRHLDVEFRAQDLADQDLAGVIAELQLQTRAQGAWAEANHDLMYKSALELPVALKRRIQRLLALVEIFDSEFEGAQRQLLELPGYPAARMLQVLDRSFLPLARRDYDRDSSQAFLDILSGAYEPDELERFETLTRSFLADAEDKLRALFAQFDTDPYAHPLLFQPEAIAVFERLDRADVRLREVWDSKLPSDILDSLALNWGHVFSRPGDSD